MDVASKRTLACVESKNAIDIDWFEVWCWWKYVDGWWWVWFRYAKNVEVFDLRYTPVYKICRYLFNCNDYL